MKALVIMNHSVNMDQFSDLKKNWSITKIVNLSKDAKKLWGNIPPDIQLNLIKERLNPIIKKIASFEFIILAGELTACTVLIDAARRQGVRILVATSRRESVETVSPSGETVKRSVFKHVQFREL